MNALSIRGLTKTYANGVSALTGIDLDVAEGDFFGLLGPNGAGKSTTIGIICSLVRKSSGTVRVFDVDVDENFPLAKSYIGLVPQEFNFSVFEQAIQVVTNQAGYYGIPSALAHERAEYYLGKLGIWAKRHEPTRFLSGGMKRRLMIARALLHEPRLLILDEPTAGVDIELRRSMWAFLREINEAGRTIILTTHYLEEAESLCRNLAIIDDGRIIQNTSVRKLLSQLNCETFVLDVDSGDEIDEVSGYSMRRVDEGTLEVDVKREQSLNPLFAALSTQGVNVLSMRNKANRLEELFLDLVGEEGA
ncbi:MAG: ABC transporter ATP-binding protein [Gammaproteobacteria bacterium]|nr:ABC transporter ATP-binding protein [Gammaproteobacteria bacterium]